MIRIINEIKQDIHKQFKEFQENTNKQLINSKRIQINRKMK
jgi:hypothetical protein